MDAKQFIIEQHGEPKKEKHQQEVDAYAEMMEDYARLKVDEAKAGQHETIVIGTLTKQEKEILKIANNALYFEDNSDYEPALWDILKMLTDFEHVDDLEFIEE